MTAFDPIWDAAPPKQSKPKPQGVPTIPCPHCGDRHSFVVDSRPGGLRGAGVRRRRQCYECGHRYSTAETVVPEWVKNGDAVVVYLDREQLAALKRAVANLHEALS